MGLRVIVTGKVRKNNTQAQPGFLIELKSAEDAGASAEFTVWVAEDEGGVYDIDDEFVLEPRKAKKGRA
jgi:hypothetical protein